MDKKVEPFTLPLPLPPDSKLVVGIRQIRSERTKKVDLPNASARPSPNFESWGGGRTRGRTRRGSPCAEVAVQVCRGWSPAPTRGSQGVARAAFPRLLLGLPRGVSLARRAPPGRGERGLPRRPGSGGRGASSTPQRVAGGRRPVRRALAGRGRRGISSTLDGAMETLGAAKRRLGREDREDRGEDCRK